MQKASEPSLPSSYFGTLPEFMLNKQTHKLGVYRSVYATKRLRKIGAKAARWLSSWGRGLGLSVPGFWPLREEGFIVQGLALVK